MPFIARIRSVWLTLVHGRRLDRELDEELQSYLTELTDRHLLGGLPPDLARRAALLEMASSR